MLRLLRILVMRNPPLVIIKTLHLRDNGLEILIQRLARPLASGQFGASCFQAPLESFDWLFCALVCGGEDRFNLIDDRG